MEFVVQTIPSKGPRRDPPPPGESDRAIKSTLVEHGSLRIQDLVGGFGRGKEISNLSFLIAGYLVGGFGRGKGICPF